MVVVQGDSHTSKLFINYLFQLCKALFSITFNVQPSNLYLSEVDRIHRLLVGVEQSKVTLNPCRLLPVLIEHGKDVGLYLLPGPFGRSRTADGSKK